MFRLWAIPLLLTGIAFLTGILGTDSTSSMLLGTGMVLGGLFALRHNLLEISPSRLTQQRAGFIWIALLIVSVLLILSSAIISFAR